MPDHRTETEVADAIGEALHTGALPTDMDDVDPDTLYRIQDLITDRHLAAGRTLAGWKTGIASPAIHELVNGNPYAPLFADALHDSGWAVSRELPNFTVEVEVEVVMGRDLAGPGMSEAEALEAIAELRPAFEVVGGPAMPKGLGDFRAFVAAGQGNHAVVSGPPVAVPADFLSQTLELRLSRAGETVKQHSITGATVIGAVSALANQLGGRGKSLRAGQPIITGAHILVRGAEAGRYEAEVGGVGSVVLDVTR